MTLFIVITLKLGLEQKMLIGDDGGLLETLNNISLYIYFELHQLY